MSQYNLMQFFLQLSSRQRQVLVLVSLGFSNREIAKQLCIEPSVVAEHLTNVYELLYISDGYEREHRPNRFVLVSLFTLFFDRNPHMKETVFSDIATP